MTDREATKRILDEIKALQIAANNYDDVHVYNWLEAESSTDRRGRHYERGGFEERRVLEVVTLTHDTLELECFSKERLSRLQDLLERKLKSTIKFLADLSMDMDTALKQWRDRSREKKAVLSNDVQNRAMKEYLSHYYLDQWINTKIPALRNKTPTEAMKTETGKSSLTQLLREMQNLEERKRKRGELYFNIDKIRNKLGLPNQSSAVE